jgi:hypothetical protein
LRHTLVVDLFDPPEREAFRARVMALAAKGYHKAEKLAECERWNTRTYIPEPKGREYNWKDKPPEWREATKANRRQTKGARSKRLPRSGASWSSGASPTCVRRGAVGGLGCGGWRK